MLYYRVSPPAAQESLLESILWENGVGYLLVDGTCHYWDYYLSANPAVSTDWASVHTGHLDQQQARALASDVKFGLWPDLPVCPRRKVQSASDAGRVEISDGKAAMWCSTMGCPDQPHWDVFQQATKWDKELYAEGTPVTGNLRGRLFRWPKIAKDIKTPSSPLPAALKPMAQTAPEDHGMAICPGTTAVMPSSIDDQLRQLRAHYRDNKNSGLASHDFLPLRDNSGQLYELYIRDTTPWENSNGLIDFGFPLPDMSHTQGCP